MEISEILNVEGLSDVLPFLEDNLIYSIDTAILLNDEELKEMIPKIGPRIKFKNWLQQQKATAVNTVNNLEIKNAEPSDSTQNAVPDSDDDEKISTDCSTAANNTESLDGRAILKEGKGGLQEGGQLPRTISRSSSKSSGSSLRSTPTITDEDIYSLESLESGIAYEETLLWLKNNVDPWKSVEEKSAEIADQRLNLKRLKRKGEIANYFKDLPALKQSQG